MWSAPTATSVSSWTSPSAADRPVKNESAIGPGDLLALVDGYNYAFRAFHALPPLTRKSDKAPVGAVQGFCSMLLNLLREEEPAPTHVAVAFDAPGKSFRNDIFLGYKANRPPVDPDLKLQFPLLRDAVRAFGVVGVEREGYEADDLIATYASQAAAAGAEVRIHSSDKDLMQLVSERVQLVDSMKKARFGPDQVKEKYGVAPERMVDLQALAGDSSDNIPGAPGIGVKTAALLLEEYGDLDSLLARCGEIKQPKRRETLQKNAKQILMSRQLATLDLDAPLPVALAETRRVDPDPEALMSFMQEMEFRTLTDRVSRWLKVEAPASAAKGTVEGEAAETFDREKYATVSDANTLARWVERAFEQGMVAIDTETDSLDEMQASLVGVALALGPNDACYIPIGHRSSEMLLDLGDANLVEGQLELDAVAEALRPLLEDPSVLKIGHNLKFDAKVLARHGLQLAPVDDTMLMSYALAAGLHRHGLDSLCQLHLGHKPITYGEITGSGRGKREFAEVDIKEATAYAAEDADASWRLHRRFRRALSAEGVSSVYETLERPLLPVLVEMERAGILVDTAALKEISKEFGERAEALQAEIHRLAGREFNVGSPKQLGQVLFEGLGLPQPARTSKSGDYQTGADVLEELAADGAEVAERVLDWRHITKLKSTYADALMQRIHPQTGRVHTSFSLAATTTGRLASTDPNLQNIPVRTEEGRRIRAAFVASPGHVLLSLDYNQIELRVLAHVAGIDALRDAFRDGVDIHAMTASQVFGVPLDKVDPQVRRQAKAINFGVIYGISGFGLARQLHIDRTTAGEFINAYFERFPGIRDYMDRTVDMARRQGWVATPFGRRIHTPDINVKGPRRGYQERAAINAPIQGGAADIIRRAMVRIPGALAECGAQAKMLLQVHDELVFEVAEKDVDAVAERVRREMERAAEPAMQLSVPLVVDAGSGGTWVEAH